MGQARQRRLAKAAGRPWPEDAPLPSNPKPWYLTEGGKPPKYAVGMIASPPEETAAAVALVRKIVRLENRQQALIIDNDPRGLSVTRRRSGTVMALFRAALAMNGQPLIKSPRR